MNIDVTGIGFWGLGASNIDELDFSKIDEALEAGHKKTLPSPNALTPKERRRVGELITIAIEVAQQACEAAKVSPTDIPSVFTSAMGDSAITDYMCTKLASGGLAMSPTKFHNSVHNAASGYWTISCENRQPSTFVTGFEYSFGISLFEAVSQAIYYRKPVLLVSVDIASSQPLYDVCQIGHSIGFAYVIEPAKANRRFIEVSRVKLDSKESAPTTEFASQSQLTQAGVFSSALSFVEMLRYGDHETKERVFQIGHEYGVRTTLV